MKLLILMIVGLNALAFGSSCIGENRCSSQLMRIEVNNSILDNGVAESLLPALGSLARSTFLQNTIVKQYEITPLAFPHNREACVSAKEQGSNSFEDVDCNAINLCERGVVSDSVKQLICFALPCTILEGNLNEGQCSGVQNIYSENIGFPEPLELKRIELSPTSIDYENGKANLCFDLKQIQGKVSASLTLDTTGTNLKDNKIEVTDLNIVMDQPRKVCVSADIDITSSNPVSNMIITPSGEEPFISNDMIINAAEGAKIKGLTGYKAENIKQLKNDLIPVLFQPLRSQVEDGVKDALAGVFEEELASLANSLGPGDGKNALYMSSSESLGILSVSNKMVADRLSISECAALKGNNIPVPSSHSCIGMTDSGGNLITMTSQMRTDSEQGYLSSVLRNTNANSPSIQKRLEALKVLVKSEPYVQSEQEVGIGDPDVWREMHEQSKRGFLRDLDNGIKRIDDNLLRESTISVIGLTDLLNEGESRELALITPELCDANNPSTHAGRSMPNCPAQVYLDLNEFNGVLESMWESGALCAEGRGSERETEIRKGCFMPIGDGFSCYLKSAPQMTYNISTRRYDTAVELEECYKGPVGGIFGSIASYFIPSLESLGSFGADFEINLSSKLKINSEGSLEASNASSTFSIVPGSESGGLLEEDRWNAEVVKGVNEAFSGALSQIIKIPVKDLTTSVLGFPIKATGQIDSGPGFIGVCFKPIGSS